MDIVIDVVIEGFYITLTFTACVFFLFAFASKAATYFLWEEKNIIDGMCLDVLGIIFGTIATIVLIQHCCFSSLYNLMGNTVYMLSILVGMGFYFEVEIIMAKKYLTKEHSSEEVEAEEEKEKEYE